MLKVRKSNERGYADHGWLKSYYSFSFANYFDSKNIHFRSLRVINEDWIEPGMGFGTHAHEDMEIITYILEGALEHKDSLGNGSVIRPGDVQKMSAGTGVQHSEFNPSKSEKVHLLQIWILPDEKKIKPSYQQKTFLPNEKANRLKLIASSDGREDSILVHQDMSLYSGCFEANQSVQCDIPKSRYLWLQMIKGRVSVGDLQLSAGDALAVSDQSSVNLITHQDSEFLIFDLK